MILDEVELDNNLRSAIIDRFEAWELIDFLNISTEEVVELFEEDILSNIEDFISVLNYGEVDTDDKTDE